MMRDFLQLAGRRERNGKTLPKQSRPKLIRREVLDGVALFRQKFGTVYGRSQWRPVRRLWLVRGVAEPAGSPLIAEVRQARVPRAMRTPVQRLHQRLQARSAAELLRQFQHTPAPRP